jgi:hypothetical protein
MSILIVAALALQLFCLVHMVRTGRPYWWGLVIFLGSVLGSLVYVITQVIPDLSHEPAARRAVQSVKRALDPEREKKRIAAELEVADTVQNRVRLAAECLALGDVLNAEELYQSCLKGPHATDPYIMLGLAQAQFARGDGAAARRTLEALIAANPDFKSSDGHLLYARALEAVGETAAALHEYENLVEGFPGEEARARYALLLKRVDRPVDAQAVFKLILARARVAPKYYQRAQREWLELAKEQLAS